MQHSYKTLETINMPNTPNILIVEDDPIFMAVIQDHLNKVFNDTIVLLTAKTIKQATSILVTNDIDVVLLDLILPDSMGYDSVKRIRELTQIPIIIVTGFEDDNLYSKAAASNVDIVIKDNLQPITQKLTDAIRQSYDKSASDHKITQRLDTIVTLIEEFDSKLKTINFRTEIDKLNIEVFGKDGLKESVGFFKVREKRLIKLIWVTAGVAGGAALTTIVTWFINYWLTGKPQ